MKERISKLVEQINQWNKEYYELDAPSVDDAIYDAALVELKELERSHPEFILENSPTKNVGFTASTKFQKHKHEIAPMLSLQNAFNDEDLQSFINNTKGYTNEYVVEPKIDGLSISVIYQDGKLVKAVTRGDGKVGEDVTNNALTIADIPRTISEQGKVIARGEVYISIANFSAINNRRAKEGKPLFANPRNAASGSIRQLDSNVTKRRNLESFFYQVLSDKTNGNLKTSQLETLDFLREQGFQVSDLSHKSSPDKLHEDVEAILSQREELDYEIDGVVIKVNDYNFHGELGYTSKFPKWAIAMKPKAEIVETELKNIVPTVGRTGRITYNARLAPVQLVGTTVSAATLHNADYIESLGMNIGDIVQVKKAGDIIPKVISVSKKKNNDKWIEAKECPSCKEKLIRKDGEVDQYCLNDVCPSKIKEKFTHFVSRKAMNIDGLSEKQLQRFVNQGFIKDFADIYTLDKFESEIKSLDGFGEKSFDNIWSSINRSRENELYRFLFGFGIRHIGDRAAQILASRFTNFEELLKAKEEDLVLLEDFGERKAKSVYEWINDSKNIELINKFISLGINPKAEKIEIDNNSFFFGKKVVVTGTIANANRTDIKKILSAKGARVISKPSKDTDFLIIGENPSQDKLSSIDKSKVIIIKDRQKLENEEF